MKANRVRFDIRRQGLPLLIGLVVVLAINGGAWALYVRPNADEYAARTSGVEGEDKKQLAEYRDSVVTAEDYVAGLEQAEADWRYLRTEVLSTRERRLVEIEQEMVRLCKEFRIDITTVQVKNEILRDEGLDRFAMVVPLIGDYGALRQFVQAVEASDKFMVIERVALASGQLRGGGKILQLNITLASYFDLEAEGSPTGPGGSRA